MEKRRTETEDSYWDSRNVGMSFDDIEQSGDFKLSTVIRKNDNLNQLDLLRYAGYPEVSENKSNQDILSSNLTFVDKENYNKPSRRRKKHADPAKNIGSKNQSPERTIVNILHGLSYPLNVFKGKKDKTKLLKTAVETHDGNTILQVILYLKTSLKKSVFQREVASYSDAVSVYLSYLEEDHEIDELTNMLLFLNKAEDAAIMKYEKTVAVENSDKKLKWIENCLSTCFQMDTIDPLLCQSVDEHKQILQDQIGINMQYDQFSDPSMKDLKTTVKVNLKKLTGRSSIIDSSVLCTLIFCWLTNIPQLILSPDKISSKYNLSKKQYTWCVLRACASMELWHEIHKLFISKSWLGGVKVRSCIAYSRLLEVLYVSSAPNEVLSKYVSCIEDEQEKLSLAKKYQCHSVVLEIFRNNKDRIGLQEYISHLTHHTKEFYEANNLLTDQALRWRN